MGITTAQIRGARGILNWSQSDLAVRTGISATSIGSIENGLSTPRESTLNTIKKAFENGGIEFIGQEGMRLRTGQVRTFQGRQGFIDFFDYLYEVLKFWNGEVLISNVDEARFLKWAGDTASEHMERMSKLESIRYKVLIKEGDMNFVASKYVEYRWMPSELFTSVPFYVFEDKLAIMLFDPEPNFLVLDYPAIADAYRAQFDVLWKNSLTPDQNKEINKA